jgi:hypothetical protein
VRQNPGNPPLRLHMIRALRERRRLLDEQAGPRKPEAPPEKRADELADVLPFGEPPACRKR